MLFNSYNFVFIYFPVVLLLFHVLRFSRNKLIINWFLILASLVFYSSGSSQHLYLICTSILINFIFSESFKFFNKQIRFYIFLTSIILNVLVLVYFKYSAFLITELSSVANLTRVLTYIPKPTELPLAISFFTFQQIAFLVFKYRHTDERVEFNTYAVSVVFFPHLIAGPLVEYKSLIPQFRAKYSSLFISHSAYLGLFVFILGLSKKLLLADSLSFYSSSLYNLPIESLQQLDFFSVLTGVIAYSFQLYFDFSGYSDMAIGLAYFFGIRLPENFNSPYKSTSLIEFWRNWHMTLSYFLRNYIYIPLGGSRQGPIKKYINLLITMLIGGIWHGAGWNFIIWGAWHGVGLCVNHIFKFKNHFSVLITYLFVMFGWIFFRSTSLEQAGVIFRKILSPFVTLNEALTFMSTNHSFRILVLISLIDWLAPNTAQLKNIIRRLLIKRSYFWLAAITLILSVLFVFCLVRMHLPVQFIYYQF